MTSCIEQLPFELLLIIFSYLEAHDLVNAFGNLNSYFRSLFVSSQIPVHTNINQVPSTSIWSILPLESIDSLTTRILHPDRLVEFLRQNMFRVVHLTTLKLDIENKDAEQVAFILPYLVSLKRLSINELSGNSDERNQLTLLFAFSNTKP